MNNLKLVNKAFELLKEKEDKINYYYKPNYIQKNKNWKRHLNFSEIKKDFIKDIIDYGFSPYNKQTSDEQMKNKILKNLFKERNHDYSKHIKKLNIFMNKKLTNNKYKLKENNKIKDIEMKKIPKIKEYKNKSFLGGLYKHINEYNLNNSKRNLSANNSGFNENKNGLTKIVKFSRDDIIDIVKMKKIKLLENELNKSFSFESDYDDNKNKINNDLLSLYKKNIKQLEDNKVKISNNFSYNKHKSMILNLKSSSFYNTQIFKNALRYKIKNGKPIKKISKIKNSNSSLIKDNSKTTMPTQDKKYFCSILKINNYQHIPKKLRNNRNKSIEKLENASGGIFKIAVKYDYLTKKYRHLK